MLFFLSHASSPCAGHFSSGPAAAFCQAPVPASIPVRHAPVRIKKILKNSIKTEPVKIVEEKADAVDFNSYHLNPALYDYVTVFFRSKFCAAGTPCSADIDITITTSRNANIHRTIQTTEDGDFLLQIPFFGACQRRGGLEKSLLTAKMAG